MLPLWLAAVAQLEAPAPPPSYLLELAARTYLVGSRNVPSPLLHLDDAGNWATGDVLRPSGGQLLPMALVAAVGELEPVRGISVRLSLDTGLLAPAERLEPPVEDARLASDGVPLREHFASGAFVREAMAALYRGPVAIELGRRFGQLGDGLVYEDYGTGGALSLQLEPWRADLAVHAVGRTREDLATPSPLAWLAVTRELSLFEHVTGFVAHFRDRSGYLTEVMQSLLAERVIVREDGFIEQIALDRIYSLEDPPRGAMTYAGLSCFVSPHEGLALRAAGAVAFGGFSAEVRTGRTTVEPVRVDMSGWAASINASYALGARAAVALTGFALSGEEPDGERVAGEPFPYTGFVAIAPYWTWTHLFFNGGLNRGVYPSRANPAGINGHGVWGGGPRFELTGDVLSFEARLALLRAFTPMPEPLGGGGSHYGIELDAIVEAKIFDNLGLGLEADVLRPGDFFATRAWAYRVIGQLHVDWRS